MKSVPRFLRVWSVAVLVAAATVPALAADEPEAEDYGTHWGLGIGARTMQRAYTDIDRDTQAAPLIMFDNRWLRVFGGTLDVKLPDLGPVELTLRADFFASDRYKRADSEVFSGMDKRRDSIWGGAAASWDSGYGVFAAELLGDLSSYSKGSKLSLQLQRDFDFGRFRLTPRIKGIGYDSAFVDYYYGVKASEATATREAYDGKSTLVGEFGLRTRYSLTPKQSVFIDLGVNVFGNPVTDSPLVDSSTGTRLTFGYLFMF